MSTPDFPTLAEVFATHRWTRTSAIDVRCTGCQWRGDLRNSGKTSVGLIAEHVEQIWRDTCTIRTTAQLDTLPDSAAILDRTGALLRRNPWGEDDRLWFPLDGHDGFDRDFGLISDRVPLTARLLWHPQWEPSHV
ncbi:hypothetical protein [Mycolicibacterium palauense]|uniref:hypothetical protein n=1 Tax=Mycolicibacterium palauense TaxID=2034511 RepID=UPI000BFEC2CE|nr:hypothetical protein [Mycolicibacterium palauense]